MKGDAVDVVIVTRAQNEELEKQGKLLAGSRAELAGVGYGVSVRTGAPRGPISERRPSWRLLGWLDAALGAR